MQLTLDHYSMLSGIALPAICVFAYLLGSIQSAVIVSRMMGLQDPRMHGSGNPGATNVFRLGGPKAAFYTLLGDASKGALPTLIAYWLLETPSALPLFCACLGHIFPVSGPKRGGKGIATAWGGCLSLMPYLGLSQLLLWLLLFRVSRLPAVASMAVTLTTPAIALYFTPRLFNELALLVPFVIYAHRENLKRIIAGTEKRL